MTAMMTGGKFVVGNPNKLEALGLSKHAVPVEGGYMITLPPPLTVLMPTSTPVGYAWVHVGVWRWPIQQWVFPEIDKFVTFYELSKFHPVLVDDGVFNKENKYCMDKPISEQPAVPKGDQPSWSVKIHHTRRGF